MFDNKAIIKLAISVVLLVSAAIVYGVAHNTQSNNSGYTMPHREQLDDESVVILTNETDILNTPQLSSLHGPILNTIYREHYEKTGKLERMARYSSQLSSLGDGRYYFSIHFLPSNTPYKIDLLVKDVETKDFTVEIN